CQRRRACELAEHLAVAWPPDVDLVEEGGDRLVVAAEQLEPFERVVVELLDLLLGRRGGILHGHDRNPAPRHPVRGKIDPPWRRCAPSASASRRRASRW